MRFQLAFTLLLASVPFCLSAQTGAIAGPMSQLIGGASSRCWIEKDCAEFLTTCDKMGNICVQCEQATNYNICTIGPEEFNCTSIPVQDPQGTPIKCGTRMRGLPRADGECDQGTCPTPGGTCGESKQTISPGSDPCSTGS